MQRTCTPPLQAFGYTICWSGSCLTFGDLYGSIGAVVYDAEGSPLQHFGQRLPEHVFQELMKHSSHPIFEVELLASLVALYTWHHLTARSCAVFYLDNEAAKGALIKAYSSIDVANRMIDHFVVREMELGVKIWFGRVCSHSNPADAPSRLEFTSLSNLGSKLVQPL